MNKKGIMLSEAFGAVLTLILIGLLVIIAVFLFSAMGTSFAGSSSGSVVNETVTMNGPVESIVSNSSLCQFGGLAVSSVNNGTYVLTSGNYTVGTTGLTNVTSLYTGPWYVSYSYTWGGQACTATDNTTAQFATFPALVGLVGTIIFLSLVIGVLVASFAFGGKQGM